MKDWLDSSQAPNVAQIAAARAAGYSGWAGYFVGPNVLHGWEQADFDRVRQGGLLTLAYCSGGQDPTAAKAQSLAWGVPIILDDEPRMRTPGPWRQDWLNISGAGHYGNYWVFPGLSAPINILAAYPGSGDPVSTWWSQTSRPPGLCGWQWAGTHDFAGILVDSSWMDDEIGETMNVYLLAHLLFGFAYGRVYGSAAPGVTTPSGYEPDADLIISRLKANPNDVGGTLGYLLGTPEGKAWSAKLAGLRAATIGPDDDSAFVTKTALKAAIGGL